MNDIVTNQAWLSARKALLQKEKTLTKLREEVAAERRAMPWRKIEKDYQFEGPEGNVSLGDLFTDKQQLIVYHFMYGPDWQEGCKSCSFWADQYDAINKHIHARDVAIACVSRAPLRDFQSFKERMGWQFNWVSSGPGEFNEDFHVSFPNRQSGFYNYSEAGVGEEMPGLSVFFKDNSGAIFHTYSTYSRGLDALNATYQMLDLVPKGRDEQALPFSMSWVNHHDRYTDV